MSELLSLSTSTTLDSGMNLFHAARRGDVVSILRVLFRGQQCCSGILNLAAELEVRLYSPLTKVAL
jgi:hypothetical protein